MLKKYEQVAKWLKELKSYKEAEEQDLLVRLIGLLFIVISADRNLIGKEVKSHDRQTYTRNNPAARYISIRSTASILRLNQST